MFDDEWKKYLYLSHCLPKKQKFDSTRDVTHASYFFVNENDDDDDDDTTAAVTKQK